MSKKSKEYEKLVEKIGKEAFEHAMELIPDLSDEDFPEKLTKTANFNTLIDESVRCASNVKASFEKAMKKDYDYSLKLNDVVIPISRYIFDLRQKYEAVIKINGGENIKSETVKKAAQLMNTMDSLLYYVIEKREQIRAIDVLRNIDERVDCVEKYETDLKEFAGSMHKNMADTDLSDIENKYSALNEEHKKVSSGIKKAEEELKKLNNSPEKSDALTDLYEKSKELSSVLVDVEKGTTVLDVFLSQLDTLEVKGADIKRRKDEITGDINLLTTKTESNTAEIERLNGIIKENKKNKEEASHVIDEFLDTNKHSGQEANDLAAAAVAKKEVNRLKEIQGMFYEPQAIEMVSFWLNGAESFNDFNNKLGEKEKALRAKYAGSDNKEEISKYMAARSVAKELINNKNFSTSGVMRYFQNGEKADKIRRELLEEYNDKQHKYGELVVGLGKYGDRIDYDKVISDYLEAERQYTELDGNNSALEQMANSLKEESVNNGNKIKALNDDIKKIQSLDHIAESLKKYKEMLENNLLDQDKTKECKEKCNSLIAVQESLKEKYDVAEYDKLLENVSNMGKELKQHVSDSLAALKNKGSKAKEALVNNSKEIEKTIISKKEEQTTLLDRLKAEECALKIKLNATDAARIKKAALEDRGEKLAKNLSEEPNNVSKKIKDMEDGLLNNTLSGMLLMYHRMNDCRRNETNSPEYKAMAEPFCACLGFTKTPDFNTKCRDQEKVGENHVKSVHDLMANLANIKDAAEKYLHEKKGNKWWHTKQYHQRVTWAKELISKCDESLKQYSDLIRVEGEIANPIKENVNEKVQIINEISGKDKVEFGKFLNGLANEEAKKENVVEVKKNEKAEVKNYAK